MAIVRLRAPQAGEALARQAAAGVASLREQRLYKPPGVAETIDWVQALTADRRSGAHHRCRYGHAGNRAEAP
ncbi:MAG: hypothetical protein V9E89_00820 [Ilumatobacteraceae bacterium]